MMWSRRRLLGITAAAVATNRAASADRPSTGTPPPPDPRPVAIASSNGLRSVELARRRMVLRGGGPLDAAVDAVNLLELDPNDSSVGLGGLPNEDGVVQLDASCMDGRSRRAGAVAALEEIASASRVARAVMEHTDHVMLVGEGAKRFALALGFEKQRLLTEESRQDWLRYRARRSPHDDRLDPDDPTPAASTHGTIHVSAVDRGGDLASATTTSGLSWKIPGRVSDSAIVGAGLYCDNRVGAAGSTGRGEACVKACGAFLVVEGLRAGLSPTDACLHALERAVAMTEDRLLDPRGRPRYFLELYALTKRGQHGGATMYEPRDEERDFGYGFYAVADARGPRYEPIAALFPVDARPSRMIM